MNKELTTYKTAKAAKIAGFKPDKPSTDYVLGFVDEYDNNLKCIGYKETEIQEEDYSREDYYLRPTQSELHKWIRDNRNVLIQVYNNASGYLWALSKIPYGSDLGYSEYDGPNASGVWDSYEDAFEDGLSQVLKKTLEDFTRDTPEKRFHWGNYADYLKKIK